MKQCFYTTIQNPGRSGRWALALMLCATQLFLGTPLMAASDSIEQGLLAAHNEARAKVGVGPLRWSDAIAGSAQQWADYLAQDNQCKMRHSHKNDLGENLYWSSAVLWSDGRRELNVVSPSDVVMSWESENRDYDYHSNSCQPSKVCGHYTQLVWANSTRLGCAYSICPDLGQIWVCQYTPPGNYVGQKPY